PSPGAALGVPAYGEGRVFHGIRVDGPGDGLRTLRNLEDHLDGTSIETCCPYRNGRVRCARADLIRPFGSWSQRSASLDGKAAHAFAQEAAARGGDRDRAVVSQNERPPEPCGGRASGSRTGEEIDHESPIGRSSAQDAF